MICEKKFASIDMTKIATKFSDQELETSIPIEIPKKD